MIRNDSYCDLLNRVHRERALCVLIFCGGLKQLYVFLTWFMHCWHFLLCPALELFGLPSPFALKPLGKSTTGY